MHSKQDQLLEKLQKCVGKIDSRSGMAQQYSHRESAMPCFGEISYSKNQGEKTYNNEPLSYGYRQNKGVTNENRRAKWKNEDQNKYLPQNRYEVKSTRNSLSKHNLTERKYLHNYEQPKQNIRRINVQQGKLKYKQNDRTATAQPAKKFNNYLDTDRPRRPLREYELNIDSNKLNQSYQLQAREPKSYLQQKESGRKYEISNTPKMEQYRPSETYDKNQTPTYRRNSVSYNQCYKFSEKLNLEEKKQQGLRNGKKSTSYESYDYLEQKKQVQAFNINNYSRQNRKNGGKESIGEEKECRELSSQSKCRQLAAGSISSVIKRNNLESSKASYERSSQRRETRDMSLQKILEEVGSANQDTFSKLQKISELNDRINMRIKNIIETFESK